MLLKKKMMTWWLWLPKLFLDLGQETNDFPKVIPLVHPTLNLMTSLQSPVSSVERMVILWKIVLLNPSPTPLLLMNLWNPSTKILGHILLSKTLKPLKWSYLLNQRRKIGCIQTHERINMNKWLISTSWPLLMMIMSQKFNSNPMWDKTQNSLIFVPNTLL